MNPSQRSTKIHIREVPGGEKKRERGRKNILKHKCKGFFTLMKTNNPK